MASVPVELRDQIISEFRQRIFDKMDFTPFKHQADWMCAADGYSIHDVPPAEGELFARVLVQAGELLEGEPVLDSLTINKVPCYVVRRKLTPREHGRARVLADLGSFKIGKSKGAGMWGAAFAAVPNARVQIVGIEYDSCAPEFEYILEALLSEQGLGLKYSSLQNRPRDGRMFLDLPNGARFEARSWERKDSLKGKEVDCYIFAEAYQLPGLECFSDNQQNLTKRQGYALFPTTPDRPWVGVFHEKGHGDPNFPDWHCTCSIPRSVNPFTFDPSEMAKNDPEKGGIMTREKFAIAYLGQLGDYVGRVYNYQRGQRLFSRATHPHIWDPDTKSESFEDLRIPKHWEVAGGADTGTFASAGIVAFDPDGDAFVLAEHPNYRYMAGVPELDETLSIPVWAAQLVNIRSRFDSYSNYWADSNSQWKRELSHYGIHLQGNTVPLETRTEIAREYFQAGKIYFAPWLKVLPFEIENAAWPEEASASGKFARQKDRDHTLDWLEHILSKRPRGKRDPEKEKKLWVEEFLGRKLEQRKSKDSHMG